MRPVPFLPSRYGFTPFEAPIGKRIETLRGLSTLAQSIGERPLQKDWEQGIQSYADAVWGAVRVLQDAAATQSNVYTLTGGYGPVPANAVPYDDAIARIVTDLAPGFLPNAGKEGGLWASWNDAFKKIPFLLGMKTVNWTVAQGSGPKLEKARNDKDGLLKRLTALRQELVNAGSEDYVLDPSWKYLVKTNETVKDAIARFKAPPAAPAPAAPAPAAPAPAPAPAARAPAGPAPAASVDEAPASTALTQVTTESAQQGPSAPGATTPGATTPGATTPGAPTPDAMPKWLLPALAVAGAAGVALLLLPMGSSNRGSRARNLDYGSVPSDANEGRMLRGTLRNLESDAHAMRQMLRDDDDLPQWVHAKVQTSADRVSGAQRYLRAKIQAPK